jgi:hypothetical protein
MSTKSTKTRQQFINDRNKGLKINQSKPKQRTPPNNNNTTTFSNESKFTPINIIQSSDELESNEDKKEKKKKKKEGGSYDEHVGFRSAMSLRECVALPRALGTGWEKGER